MELTDAILNDAMRNEFMLWGVIGAAGLLALVTLVGFLEAALDFETR